MHAAGRMLICSSMIQSRCKMGHGGLTDWRLTKGSAVSKSCCLPAGHDNCTTHVCVQLQTMQAVPRKNAPMQVDGYSGCIPHKNSLLDGVPMFPVRKYIMQGEGHSGACTLAGASLNHFEQVRIT